MARYSIAAVQRRVLVLLLILIAAAGLLTVRLAYLQLWQNEFFQAKALEQRLQRIPIEGLRGGIYDRNGVPLAVSVSAAYRLRHPRGGGRRPGHGQDFGVHAQR